METIRKCEEFTCPFFFSSEFYNACRISKTKRGNLRVLPQHGKQPKWCRLRNGPVTFKFVAFKCDTCEDTGAIMKDIAFDPRSFFHFVKVPCPDCQ
jgi:hypothetical protein